MGPRPPLPIQDPLRHFIAVIKFSGDIKDILLLLVLEFDVRFNPDAYNEEVRHAECEVSHLHM